SVWLGLVATAICLVLAYPIAYYISQTSGNSQRTLVMLIMLPMWMNFLLRTYAWMNILEDKGIINGILGKIGLGPVQMLNTRGAVVLGMVYNFLPYMILPIYSVMAKLDRTFVEAASDLGCNKVRVMSKIIVPLSLPGIISGVTMVFVPSVSTFFISNKLGGTIELIGDVIENKFTGVASDYNLGAALSLVLMILILACLVIMNRFADDDGAIIV
ncbi:MAG: ABC transporter permease, partial [Oscillospiraceae bacterium]|nr:ABC transporter permease [Oscillospiraceae bacterium]